MFRHAGDKIVKNYRKVMPSASTNGNISSSDIGKLCQGSSNHGELLTGSSTSPIVILGIVALVPTATTPGSTVPFYVAPILPGELIEADYSTNSTDIASTNFILAASNINYVYRVCGAGTSSGNNIGGQFIDPTTAQTTLAGSTVGMFRVTEYSTETKTVKGIVASSYLNW